MNASAGAAGGVRRLQMFRMRFLTRFDEGSKAEGRLVSVLHSDSTPFPEVLTRVKDLFAIATEGEQKWEL